MGSASMTIMPAQLRVRFRMHLGSHLECLYLLSTYGISSQLLPFDSSTNKVKFEMHMHWIQSRIAKESAAKNPELASSSGPTIISTPSINDVLYIGGKKSSNAGNHRLRILVKELAQVYDTGNNEKKRAVVDAMIHEITNTGAISTGATMKQICSTVISSGGYQGRSQSVFAGRGLTYYTMTTAGTFYNLVSIRLRTAGINKVIVPSNLNILTDSNQNLHYKLLLNATANTTLSFSNASTFVESSTTSATITGGTQIGEGFITNKGEPVTLEGQDLFTYQLGRTIDGTSDLLTIAVTADSNNVTVGGGLGWYQL